MNIVKKVCNWYFSKGALPYWGILFLDCSAVFFSGLTVYYFRHGGMGLAQDFWQVTNGLLLSLVLYVMAFFVFHTFRGVMRYASFVDLHGVVYSTATAGAAVCLLHQVEIRLGLTPYIIMPRLESAILIFIIATMMMWALRILVRTLHDLYRGADDIQKVFVYGCMQGGIALAKSIRENTTSKYRLGGFVSSDKSLSGNWLLGVQIYYDDDNLVSLMQKKRAKAIFVSPFVVEHFTRRTALIDELINADIKIFMMSDAEEWDGKSDLSHHQLREVEIEDLLPREKIEVDLVAIGSMLRDKRILITGAAGSIGSEMVRQIAKFSPAEFILVDQAETPMHDVRRYMARNYPSLKAWTIVGSITNKDQMEEIFRHHHPEYVFHAAAYKHVPMMEDNPAMAVQNNIYGTRVIADLAVKYGTKKFVMISTDKAVNPTNVMGCSKRICEIYCQSLNKKLEEEAKVTGKPATQFITTRFGNVLGSNGSVIPIFKEQIKKGGPVMVTHPDIIRYFMLIPEACRLVLQAGTMGKGGEIFVFDMGAPVKIVDLAKRMIRLSGAQNIEIKFSGLRDGEKLYEEVLNDKEVTKGTTNPKIMVAAVREYPYDLAVRNEKELYDLSFTFDDMQIVKKMKAIVPEYKSQHSKYQELDE
ncbi:polysaccharide biosynthesis protein [Segatella baroniae]|uniref:polysaccharide biosynthesis protein n=1 Tax=Segatella baroniae TaxID=305719 RepID=UPI0004152D20|nr:nucleoside-diphosphate sugar epimerase/dehydratase [Segatella baroniae]